LETIDSVYRNGSSAQQFIVEHIMENDVKTLYTNVSEEYQNLETASASFHFDETINLPPLPITEYVPGQLTLQFLRQGDISAVMSLTPVSSVDLKKTGDDINEPLYTGIDVLPDGRVVAVDNENKKCLVYNEKLEKVGSCQLSYVPQSVVAVTEEEVAITSGSDYRVEFFKVRQSNEIISIRKCEVKTKYDSICLKDNRQFIVGTIDYQRPVRILSLTGEEKDFSMMFSNKTYSLDTNACTYIRSIDKVVIAERYEHTVYIYDVKTNMKVEVKDDRILNPCGVAVGPSDTIFVCSNGTDSIVQISQTGQILSSHKIDMDLPYKACVSRDKSFLVVTNSCIGDLKLKKFKIS
jgi:WD40 repeat protein